MRRQNQRRSFRDCRGFTILEAAMAAGVMLLGISSSIVVLQRGMDALDTARATSLAAQIMQSEMESLRLKNWAQVDALPASANVDVATNFGTSSGALGASLDSFSRRFTCTRTVSTFKTDMKRIVLEIRWEGLTGRPQSLQVESRYGKNGLYDYLYTSH